ncbi:hypothetical protein G7Z17_g9431 [Cylindrodendrum hubeiense]|uniref:Uncharacterized protein n=1 Tax=Cylindrodendrum hubeiense TaxID=595255 RepID=A0A9P5LC72_9HYPO|nr:hypothetical protein G7Z17_g9431 [Cylindrodendrum hubeiense]
MPPRRNQASGDRGVRRKPFTARQTRRSSRLALEANELPDTNPPVSPGRPPASEPTDVDTPPTKYNKTARVRCVPLDWDSQRLQSFLEEDDSFSGPVVMSLANEIDGCSKTGTVTFHTLPVRFQTPPTGQTWRIPLPKTSDNHPVRNQQLLLDHDFIGITTLYIPALDDHKIEYVT